MIPRASVVSDSVYVCEPGYCGCNVVVIGFIYEVINIYFASALFGGFGGTADTETWKSIYLPVL